MFHGLEVTVWIGSHLQPIHGWSVSGLEIERWVGGGRSAFYRCGMGGNYKLGCSFDIVVCFCEGNQIVI